MLNGYTKFPSLLCFLESLVPNWWPISSEQGGLVGLFYFQPHSWLSLTLIFISFPFSYLFFIYFILLDCIQVSFQTVLSCAETYSPLKDLLSQPAPLRHRPRPGDTSASKLKVPASVELPADAGGQKTRNEHSKHVLLSSRKWKVEQGMIVTGRGRSCNFKILWGKETFIWTSSSYQGR